MSRQRLLLWLRCCGAQLAILVGAYVSLGTSCGSVAKDVDLVRHIQLPAGVTQKQLQLSIATDGTIREVRLRFEPGITIIVDAVNNDSFGGGEPVPPTLEGDTTIVACQGVDCEELFVALQRDDATQQLDLTLTVGLLVQGQACAEEPEFIELEVTELSQ